MYHPSAMLKIAHDREAELVREARVCGVSQAKSGRPQLALRVLLMSLGMGIMAAVARLLAA